MTESIKRHQDIGGFDDQSITLFVDRNKITPENRELVKSILNIVLKWDKITQIKILNELDRFFSLAREKSATQLREIRQIEDKNRPPHWDRFLSLVIDIIDKYGYSMAKNLFITLTPKT